MPGLQAVVDALAIEGIDAARCIADEHPIGAGDTGHGAAHGQQRRPGRAHVVVQLPILALAIGVVGQQTAQVDVGRSTTGGKCAHADIHLAVAEGEDPSVARKDAIVLAPQLKMG